MLNLTNQEMFNRAYIGCKSQDWYKCVDDGVGCVYALDTKHCAWGWVDTSLTTESGGVHKLHVYKIGLAAELDENQLDFASDLQFTHDNSYDPHTLYNDTYPMSTAFHKLAEKYGLTIPANGVTE